MSDSAWQMVVCVCVYNFILPTANRVLSLGKLICVLCGVPDAIPRFWTVTYESPLERSPCGGKSRLSGGLFKMGHSHQITFLSRELLSRGQEVEVCPMALDLTVEVTAS